MLDRAQCVIVGAGVLGASVAYHLEKQGFHDFVLLDQDATGREGTTSQSAAMLVHQTMDAKTTRLAQKSVQAYADLQARGFDIGYRRTGGLLFTAVAENRAVFEYQSQVQNEAGLRTHLLGPTEMRQKAGELLNVAGLTFGLFCEDEGYLNPRKLVDVYRESVGVDRYFKGEAVARILQRHRRVYGVKLKSGHIIETECVVNSAGAEASKLARPLGVYLPLALSQRSLVIMNGPQISETFDAGHFLIEDYEREWYFRPDERGVLAGVGPTRRVKVQRPNLRVPKRHLALLKNYVQQRVPGLWPYEVIDAWAGNRHLIELPGTGADAFQPEVQPDVMLPILGPAAGLHGYLNCCGAGAYGITLGSIAGELVAAAVMNPGEAHELKEYSSDRFLPTTMEG